MPTKIYNTHTIPRAKIHSESNLTKMLEPPSGGELKLLTHLSAENWAHNWVIYISNSKLIYDELYNKIGKKSLISSEKLSNNLEKIIRKYSPIIPLYYDMSVRIVTKNITGLEANAVNQLNLKKVLKN